MTSVTEEMIEALKPFADFGERNTDAEGWAGTECQRERIVDWFGPSDFRRARAALEAALSASPAAQTGVVADAREIELNLKARQRVAFRRALAELPEIAPPEVASLLSSVHMQDEFLAEGKRLQIKHGLDAVSPRVEQECGAGAWSFMRQGVLSALAPSAPQPTEPVADPDNLAVDRFAVAMKAKLKWEREERGRGGWQRMSADDLSTLLYEHLPKRDPVDVANFCMMLHQNGQALSALASPVAQQREDGWFDMSIAPKNGTRIVVQMPDGPVEEYWYETPAGWRYAALSPERKDQSNG